MASAEAVPSSRLTPVVIIEGKRYVVMTPELAGVPARLLKTRLGSLEQKRSEIVSALDMLSPGF